MQVKMLKTMASPTHRAHAGDVVDLPEEQALALLEDGYAEEVAQIAADEEE